MATLAGVALVALLLFVGRFYTAERGWSAGMRIGATIISHPPLRAALDGCVSAHDPAALATLRSTGSYRTSGWFLDEKRQAKISRCMRMRGWLRSPVRLYSF